jgi:hypothetical protein
MLQANVLANPEHFRQHVLLVFQNAFQFNTDAAPAFLYAKRMEKEFNRLWDEMIARWKQEGVSLAGWTVIDLLSVGEERR